MCKELLIEVNEKSDIRYIKEQIRQNFSYELNCLEQLPHIIETEDYIFVHAGITSENLEEQELNERRAFTQSLGNSNIPKQTVIPQATQKKETASPLDF